MEDLENLQFQEGDLTIWDRFKKLSNKKIVLSDKGKVAIVSAVGTPALYEGITHMSNTAIAHSGNIGVGISIAATIIGLLHGDKAIQAGRWIKERIVEDNGLQPSSSEERTPSLKERFLEANGLQPQSEGKDFVPLRHPPAVQKGNSWNSSASTKRGVEHLDEIPQDTIFLMDSTRGPVTEKISDLGHIALSGVTGGGKTNMTRMLVSQLLAQKCTVWIANPNFAPVKVNERNMEDWRPIAAQVRIARTDREIDELLHDFIELFEERQELEQHRSLRHEDVFLVLCEWPVIHENLPEAHKKVGRLLRQSRQYGIHVVTEMQDALIKTIGGSSGLRAQFKTAYYFGGDSTTAAALMHATNLPAKLPRGEVFLRSASCDCKRGTVSLFRNSDLYRLLGTPYDPVPDDGIIEKEWFPDFRISRQHSLRFPAQNTRLLPEMEMEMLPGNNKMHQMHGSDRSISDHMETVEDTFASTSQELINFLENSGKCPNALLLVREQSLNFASGTENRTISQIAKDWGFESGRNWQKATGLLEALKSAIEVEEDQ